MRNIARIIVTPAVADDKEKSRQIREIMNTESLTRAEIKIRGISTGKTQTLNDTCLQLKGKLKPAERSEELIYEAFYDAINSFASQVEHCGIMNIQNRRIDNAKINGMISLLQAIKNN